MITFLLFAVFMLQLKLLLSKVSKETCLVPIMCEPDTSG